MNDIVVVGSYVQDLAFTTATFPQPGETRIGTFCPGPGGKGFNQAVAAHRQEVCTAFIGAVGDDAFAHSLQQFATSEQLPLYLHTDPSQTTGAASIVVADSGENSIVVALGANGTLPPEHITAHAKQFAGAKVVVTQAECNLEATKRAIEIGKQNGALTILNPAPINADISLELLAAADCITPNETEFAFLLEKLFSVSCDEPIASLSDATLVELANHFPTKVVLLTLGSAGVAIAHTGSGNEMQPLVRLPACSVPVVDTTGAGDAFNGGFAAGLVRYGGDIVLAARYGIATAGLAIQQPGTAPAMPRRQAVFALLEENEAIATKQVNE